MNMPHPCLEHQERTIAANDLSGENALPLHMRITAVGRMPWRERFAYMSAAPVMGGRGAEPSDKTRQHRNNSPVNKRKIWERTGERSFLEHDSFVSCAHAHGQNAQSMRSLKKQALARDPEAYSILYKKTEYWWKDPRDIIPDAEVRKANVNEKDQDHAVRDEPGNGVARQEPMRRIPGALVGANHRTVIAALATRA